VTGVIERVLVQARRGGSVATIAAQLGMPPDLVAAVVAELVAAGVAVQPGCRVAGVAVQPGCRVAGVCAVAEQGAAPSSCAGCPLVR